jgi:hypothetical protein
VEWVVASFRANLFCSYKQADQIGGGYVWSFDPFFMAMLLSKQYTMLDSHSRTSIALAYAIVPLPNLLYVGHTSQH